jgi:hypothetical protein
MSKYLELFKGAFDDSIGTKTKLENKPYIGYSLTEGKLAYTIVPKEPTSTYQMVDLGLSVKWADRNIGASSPEDAGLYFQWGDTVGYTADQVGVDKVFNWDSYFDTTDRGRTFKKYNNNGGLTVLESSDDAAAFHMGTQYRMPTSAEIQELISGTTQSFIDIDGNEYSQEEARNGAIESGNLKGVRFTGSNGNSIFIPAAGGCNESLLGEVGMNGVLRSSSLVYGSGDDAWSLYFYYNGNVYENSSIRYCGSSVRGVLKQ